MAEGVDTTGKLLVATPLIGDGNFERTVVLMLAHQEEGAAGVVLNRPSGLLVSDALPQWAPHLAPPPTMFIGGPVSNESVVALARVRHDPDQGWWTPVLGLVGTLDLEPTRQVARAVEESACSPARRLVPASSRKNLIRRWSWSTRPCRPPSRRPRRPVAHRPSPPTLPHLLVHPLPHPPQPQLTSPNPLRLPARDT